MYPSKTKTPLLARRALRVHGRGAYSACAGSLMARRWRYCTLPTDEYPRACVCVCLAFFFSSDLDGDPHRWQRGVHQANRGSPSTVHAGRGVPGVGAGARYHLGLHRENIGEVLSRVPSLLKCKALKYNTN